MKTLLLTAAFLGLLTFGLAGCESTSSDAHAGHAHASGQKCETCEQGLAGEPVYCDHCNKGFVNGKAVECKGCFVAKTGGPACTKCAAN